MHSIAERGAVGSNNLARARAVDMFYLLCLDHLLCLGLLLPDVAMPSTTGAAMPSASLSRLEVAITTMPEGHTVGPEASVARA